MLLVTANWIYILFLCLIFGHIIWTYLRSDSETSTSPNFSILVVSGMMILTGIAALFSLFYKVSWEINIVLFAIALFWVNKNWKELRQLFKLYRSEVANSNLLVKGLFVLTYIVAISFSSTLSDYNDDGLYYVQTITWIEEYGVVPGLANLHNKLGFNTNWHCLSALFAGSYFGAAVLHDINGLLYLVFVIYLLQGLQSFLSGSTHVEDIIKSLLLIPIFIFLKLLLAPSSDLPAIFVIWMCFTLLLGGRTKQQSSLLLTALFCIYLITLKLSTLSVAIVAVFVFVDLFREAKFRTLGKFSLLAVIIAVPWLIRNVVISGYLLYPFESLDLFNVDWKMHPLAVKDEADFITSYAVSPDIHPSELNKMSIVEWMPIWLKGLSFFNLTIVGSAFTFLILIATVGAGKLIKRGNEFVVSNRFELLVFSTCLAGLLLWLLKAPDPRFSYGFTFFVIYWGVAYILLWLLKKYGNKILSVIVSIVITSTTILSLIIGYAHYNVFEPIHILKPAERTEPELRTLTIDNIEVYMPTNSKQCWNSPLPCSPVPDYRLRLRGDDIADGFYVNHSLPVKTPSEAFPE